MTWILFALALGLAAGAPTGTASAQEPQALERLGRYRAYLERNPYHDTVFDQLVHEALELGRLAEVERDYAERLERDGADGTARVVLARMFAREQRTGEALALLDEAREESAPFLYLRGRLRLAAGERPRALGDLEAAAAASADRLLAGEILTLAGRTWSQAGDDEAAARAFRAFAELEPRSFTQRLEAARLMEESRLEDAALVELERAIALAGGDAPGGDAPKEVRARIAMGRVQERRGRVAEADAAYRRAAALLGPGHWQRAELFERRLGIHRGRATLDELIDDCRDELESRPTDPDVRRFLARALRAAGRSGDALEVLARAARDFPASLEVGLEHAEFLSAEGRLAAAVAEYQRLAERHPRQGGLHREAGTLLATLEGPDAGRAQWARELALAPESIDLRIELAALHARFGLEDEADDLLRAAIEIAPGDLRPVRALAERWSASARGARVATLLDQVERAAAARGDAHALEELAGEWTERNDERRAARALELALDAGGERERLLTSLSVLLEGARQSERAIEVAHELFTLARTPAERARRADELARLYGGGERLLRLVRDQRRALHANPGSLHAALLLVRGLGLAGEYEQAREVLAQLGRVAKHRADALRHGAWLAETQGGFADAARALRELLELQPSDRRQVLEEIARLHRRAGDAAGAEAAYDELLALSPTHRSLLVDLAHEARQRDPEQAVELLRRSLELYPGEDATRLELAELYVRKGHVALAADELARLLRAGERAMRVRARAACREWLNPWMVPALAVPALRERLEREPERFELAVLAALLAREGFEYAAAFEVCEEALLRYPREPALLELREELRGLSLASLETELLPGAAADGAQLAELELADRLLAQGELSRALRGLDPALGANLCLARGAPREAQRLLREACRRTPDDPHLRMRLAVALLADGRDAWASREVDEALRIAGERWHLLLFQGELRQRSQERHGAREVGARLLASLARSRPFAASEASGRALHERRVREVLDYHVSNGLERDFLGVGSETLLRGLLADSERGLRFHDPPLLDAVLSRMGRFHARRARELLAAARAAGPPLAGWDAAEWSAMLARHAERFRPRALSD